MNDQAVRIAVKIIKLFEGFCAFAYPDPSSDLYKALSQHGMLQKYMAGTIRWKDLAPNFQALDGAPFTVGFGETKGVTKNTVWTLEQATAALEARAREFMAEAIKDCPRLATESPERIAAITSFAYNVGSEAFATSTACKRIMAQDDHNVPEAMQRYNKAGGKIMDGLVKRRLIESNLWMSTK